MQIFIRGDNRRILGPRMDDRYSFKKSTDDRYRLRQACPSFRPEFVRVVIDNDIDGAEV